MNVSKFIKTKIKNYLYSELQKNTANNNSEKNVIIYNDWIGINLIVDGYYEHEELKLIVNNIPKSNLEKSAVDVGANIGNHTLYFSNYFKKVISFEPQKNVYEILNLNCLKKLNIETYNHGLGNANALVSIYVPNDDCGMASVQKMNIDCREEKIEIKVYDEHYYGEEIGLIKIDTEGSELEVLEGMKTSIRKYTPIICFELNRDIDNRKRVIEYLYNLGYINFYVKRSLFFPYNLRAINYVFPQPKSLIRANKNLLFDGRYNYNTVIATSPGNDLASSSFN
jgi:FkbM family methyltransferase